MQYKYSELTAPIIAAAMEVHRELRCGFQEVVYQRCLEIEFSKRQMVYARELEMPIYYKGYEVGLRRVDFLVSHIICVELKAVSDLLPIHVAQGLNYLEAFNFEVGLLINFGSESLQVKRLFNKKYKPLIVPGQSVNE
jgi:GxxExxY protein